MTIAEKDFAVFFWGGGMNALAPRWQRNLFDTIPSATDRQTDIGVLVIPALA